VRAVTVGEDGDDVLSIPDPKEAGDLWAAYPKQFRPEGKKK
jgi:hypothetical protein